MSVIGVQRGEEKTKVCEKTLRNRIHHAETELGFSETGNWKSFTEGEKEEKRRAKEKKEKRGYSDEPGRPDRDEKIVQPRETPETHSLEKVAS